jgi:tRNA threonylcarbamoyladenosine biosynthesis protein TsaB
MVSVLAFDCAGHACSAALLREDELVARRFERMERGHAEALIPMIAAVLDEAGLAVEALDLIAVTTGPGAFTGLRIGLAAARALALASGVPLIGISNFAAVAAAVAEKERAGRRLIVALDSKRREFYLQRFAEAAPDGDGALVAPEDAARWVPPGKLLLAGDAAPALAQALGPDRDAALAEGPGLADAAEVARLGAAHWRPGQHPAPPQPLYLREPDTTLPRKAAPVP